MNKIHLEKENIGRIILKVPLFCLFAACFYFFLFEERKIFPLIISVVGFVIVGFSIFTANKLKYMDYEIMIKR